MTLKSVDGNLKYFPMELSCLVFYKITFGIFLKIIILATNEVSKEDMYRVKCLESRIRDT